MNQRALVVALLGLATTVGACGKKADPNMTPAPVPSSTPVVTAPAPARSTNADSVARAEAGRREAERAALVNQLAETIHFEYDQFVIGADDTGRLDRKAAIMKAQVDFKTAMAAVDKNGEQIKALNATRKASIQTAITAFKTTLDAAAATLKTALGQ